MKHTLFLLGFALSASLANAQTEPKISIGQIETSNSMNIGGQVLQSQRLKFTDLKVLGTWISKDKAGRYGYVFVDNAQQTQWENKKLVVSLGGKLSDVKRVERWQSGEAALVFDVLNDEAAAILRQGNFHAPISEQLKLQWQPINGTKVRLTTTMRGSGSLRIAPDNAQVSFNVTRNGQPLEPRPVGMTKRASQLANFETLTTGAMWQRDFDLSRYADLSQAGRYQVQVRYEIPAQNGGTLESNVVKLGFDDKFDLNLPAK